MPPCPVCGSETNPKADARSAWCSDCTAAVLLEQKALDVPTQDREYIG